ncbi:E3 ubiquitin-protein ligase [Dirofilaria immitis]
MQSDRKQLAEGEQNVNQEGSTHFIRFQESVNVDVPNSPKTISDSSKSEKRACRICQSETGELVRPCACTGTNIVEISSVICLSLCLWYMITLTIEREFFNRIFIAGLPPRSPDVARIRIWKYSLVGGHIS